MLEGAFPVEKVEELVLNERPSQAATVLRALKRLGEPGWGRKRGSK